MDNHCITRQIYVELFSKPLSHYWNSMKPEVSALPDIIARNSYWLSTADINFIMSLIGGERTKTVVTSLAIIARDCPSCKAIIVQFIAKANCSENIKETAIHSIYKGKIPHFIHER